MLLVPKIRSRILRRTRTVSFVCANYDDRKKLQNMMTTSFIQNFGLIAAGCAIAVAGSACRSTQSASRGEPRVVIREASPIQFRGANSAAPDKPGESDCNNPAHWDGDTLYIFNSAGHPFRSAGADVFHLQTNYVRCEYDNKASGGRWIECTWKVADGTLYG